MKKIILLFIFLITTSAFSAQVKMHWQEDKKLEFSDFQGIPNNNYIAALSYCGISCNSCTLGNNPTYEIQAYFQPQNSWVWHNYKYKYVLRHEQLHFDIAELYARKLRKYMHTHNVSIRESRSVFKRFYKEYENTQELYDEETTHGTNSKVQREWEDKISSELEAFSNYKENKCY